MVGADTAILSQSAPEDAAEMRTALRNCYFLMIGNCIWLLVPAIGLVTGNNLHFILWSLLAAAVILFLSNNYIARHVYYMADKAKGSIYESHLQNIDNMGFFVFFVTMIGGLAFLLTTVFILNAIKSQSGFYIFLGIDLVLSVTLGALAFWVVTHSLGGLVKMSQSQAYVYKKIAGIF